MADHGGELMSDKLSQKLFELNLVTDVDDAAILYIHDPVFGSRNITGADFKAAMPSGGGGGGGIPATTVVSETAFGQTPAVGTSTKYARQDHTHGTPGAIIDILYADLYTLYDAATLVAGQRYRITDYRTKHRIYGTLLATPEYYTGATEALIVQAVSLNSLALEAYSEDFPQDIIHYELVDSTAGRDALFGDDRCYNDWGCDRGRIIYREDTVHNVSMHCDFRNYRIKIAKINDDPTAPFDMFPQDGESCFYTTLVPVFNATGYASGQYGAISLKPIFAGGMQRIAFLWDGTDPSSEFHKIKKVSFDFGAEQILCNGYVYDIDGDTCAGIYTGFDQVGRVTIGSGSVLHLWGAASGCQFLTRNEVYQLAATSMDGVDFGAKCSLTVEGNLTDCKVMTGYVTNITGDHTGELIGYPSSGGGGGSASVTQIEVDFGATPATDNEFTITDAAVTATSKIIASLAYEDTADNTADEIIACGVVCTAGKAEAGSFKLLVASLNSALSGKYKINYIVG
jgi:hypothetical protein